MQCEGGRQEKQAAKQPTPGRLGVGLNKWQWLQERAAGPLQGSVTVPARKPPVLTVGAAPLTYTQTPGTPPPSHSHLSQGPFSLMVILVHYLIKPASFRHTFTFCCLHQTVSGSRNLFLPWTECFLRKLLTLEICPQVTVVSTQDGRAPPARGQKALTLGILSTDIHEAEN